MTQHAVQSQHDAQASVPTVRRQRQHGLPARHAKRNRPARTRSVPTDLGVLVVIVPAHDEAEQIAETIESLLRQSRPADRIVVAADNCTDATVAIARRYPVTVMETVDNSARKAGAMNQAWERHARDADYGLTLDLKTLGYEVRAAPLAHVLTDTPDTFRALWRQRQRWGRGGIDECRQRGWTPATRLDITSYGLFLFSICMRVLFVAYITLLILSPFGYALSLLGLIPIAVLWVDRVTSAWRLPGRDGRDVLVASTLVLEDGYGLYLELCTLVALVKSLRATRQSW